MTNPSHTSDLVGRAHPAARPRSALGAVAVAVLTLVVLGAAACGGGSSKSSASSTAGTTNAPAGESGRSGLPSSFLQQAVKYAQCMRSHGVTKFPDPNPTGDAQGINQAGIDPNSPTFQSAAQACKKYQPTVHSNPNQVAQAKAQALKYAQCMRSHGITKFPDPSGGPGNGGGPQSLSQYGIDINSPAFKAANTACQKYNAQIPDGG